MHIPSGFLQPQVWIPMTGISTAGVGYALKKSGHILQSSLRTMFPGTIICHQFPRKWFRFS